MDLFRKVLLRRQLLTSASEGPAYVPFIGEGDIAADLYADRIVYGADLDPARVATAGARLPGSTVIVADCNGWPFPGLEVPFAVADLDAYSNPYLALVSFWEQAKRTDPVVIFGTDGQRQTIRRQNKSVSLPECKPTKVDKLVAMEMGNRWWEGYVLPFIEATVAPWHVLRTFHYYRGPAMLYWGAIIGSAPRPGGKRSAAKGATFTPPGTVKRQTSAHYREQVAKRVAKRHAKVKPFTKAQRAEVLERDQWTCWICEKPIDPAAKHPDRMSASIDHVLPVAAGGDNSPENLRAAHLGCNGRKRSAVGTTNASGAQHEEPDQDETPDEPEPEDEERFTIREVEAALVEAAKSGNVPAAMAYLERRDPARWGKGAARGMGSALVPMSAPPPPPTKDGEPAAPQQIRPTSLEAMLGFEPRPPEVEVLRDDDLEALAERIAHELEKRRSQT